MEIRAHRYVLAVPDLDRTAAWFAAVLGCAREDVDPGNWAFLTAGDVTFMCGRCPDALPAGELGDHGYFAYLVVDQLDEVIARATAAGAVVRPARVEPWGMRELPLRTCDGHRLMVAEVSSGPGAP
jgi:predicted enzyme related to lactoylglutathione lyase